MTARLDTERDAATASPAAAEPILSVRHLSTHFEGEGRVARAVDDMSLDVRAGELVAVVGESGCGKSMTALSIMRLVPTPPGRIVAGEVRLAGRDLLKLGERAMRKVRGGDVAMIFQEPLTSLNPVFTIGSQIEEALKLHTDLDRKGRRARVVEMLRLVRIPDPERRADQYPHELSGGMRQRVMIAMALACDPVLLIADEPTTALDVTIQAEILALIAELRTRTGAAVLLITHDLGVVAEVADHVVVMYAGRVVERARVDQLFAAPAHPYSLGLLGSLPRLGGSAEDRLREIPGVVPALTEMPPGCAFADRCPFARPRCREAVPPLVDVGGGHEAACFEVERVLAEGRS
jgi:peptide/nickel transport system ATP-binding protein